MIESKVFDEQSQPVTVDCARTRALESDPQQLLHDLRVHQTELELQNEELRRTQLELELSRARYFDLYDLAPVAYFTLSQDGMIQEANLTAATLLGVPRAALVKQPLSQFILIEDHDVYYHHRRQLFENGVRQVCELRLMTDRASPCWVRFEATTVTDSAGGLVCRAVVSDISARRRAEDTLRASEARHRILFESSHDALLTLSPPDWRFTSGNSTALRMFDVPDEATFVSQPHWTYYPQRQPDGRASAEKASWLFAKAMREGSHYYDWTFRRPSGQEFPATVLLTRLEIDHEALLQATIRDETEVKRLQAMLHQSDRLASMGMLAASVAHEINNPLTYVIHNIESLMVELPKINSAAQHCLDTPRGGMVDETLGADDGTSVSEATLTDLAQRAREVRDGAERIRSIAKAMGTFSRLESTQGSRINLNLAIESAVTMARTTIRVRSNLVVDLGALPPVWASEGKLSQVFLNLLINAAQAIEEGNADQNRIEVRTWADADHVFATVTDTGTGIARESLGRIFDPFFTTKSRGEGSGLGLCICRNIVTDFGGDISVESEPGEGTRFVIRLPIQKSEQVARCDEPVSTRPASASARGRILVVDDEPAIRAMLVQVLGVEHEVLIAESGEEACAILEDDQSFDVILCDLMMLEMTGMDLHSWLAREHPKLAARVVFITGGAFTARALDYVHRVGNPLLHKPFDTVELARVLAEVIGPTSEAMGMSALRAQARSVAPFSSG